MGGGGSAAAQVGRRCRLAGLLQRLLQLLLEVVERLLGLVERELAPLDQRLGEQLPHRAPLVDLGVHQRLRVAGVVALVVAVPPVADEIDDDVLVERLAVGVGEPGHPHAGLGVVAVHVEDRRLHDLGHVGGVEARAGGLGRGGEPDLVVDHDVDRAADPVALDVAHVERLGHDTLAGEGGVAVHEDGQHREGLGDVDLVLLSPHHALDHGVDGLEVAGVGGQLDLDAVAVAALELADLAEVVLHVARALDRGGVERALELLEHLVVVLADDRGEDVEPPAVGHAHDGALEPLVGGGLEDGVEDRDQALAALDAEALLPDPLGAEELLERLGRVEPVEDVALVVDVERLLALALDLVLDPALLVQVLDVHVLDADGAAVGVAQDPQDLAEDRLVLAAEAAREELAVEVPDREPVGGGVELGRHPRLFPPQRVEVGDEVAAHPVDADERGDGHLLLEGRVLAVERVDVAPPLDGLVGHAQAREDVVVEAVGPEQQLLDALEEDARLGALDDAVVVGRGDGDDLGRPEVGQHHRVGAAPLGREVDGAHAHDDALARHEPRHRLLGADGARVGEGDGGAREVVDGQLVGADLADDLLVGTPEGPEVEGVGVADDRHEQAAAAVGLLEVDGQAEPDVLVADDPGLAVGALDVASSSSAAWSRGWPARWRSR